MKYRCCSCRKPIDKPYKLLRHGRDDLNQHTSRRKPVAWCRKCWDESVKFNEDYKRRVDAENKKLAEAINGSK